LAIQEFAPPSRLCSIALTLTSCAGQQYSSKRQKEGENLLPEWKFDQAIAAFKAALRDAENAGDKREIAHRKSLLGGRRTDPDRD